MSPNLEGLIASSKNVPIDIMQADLRLHNDVRRFIEQIQTKYTALTHILHLAAGRFHHMRLKQFNSALVKEEVETQVFSAAEAFRALLPTMAHNKYGKVVVMLTAYTIGIPPKFISHYII